MNADHIEIPIMYIVEGDQNQSTARRQPKLLAPASFGDGFGIEFM